MAKKSFHKTKIILLGVIVGLISLITSLDGADMSIGTSTLADSPLGDQEARSNVEQALKLEKLALSKKMVSRDDEILDKEQNSMLN